MTNDIALTIAQTLYISSSGAYFVVILLVLYVFSRVKDPFIKKVFWLASLACLYSVDSFILTLGPFDEEVSKLLFPLTGCLGSLTFAVYLNVLTDFLGISSRFLNWVSYSFKLVAVVLVFTAPFSLLVHSGGAPSGNWMMDHVLGSVHVGFVGQLMMGCAASFTLISLLFILIYYRDALKKDVLITVGVVMTLITSLSDNLMGLGVPYVFSTYGVGFLFEIVRFTFYVVEIDFKKKLLIADKFRLNLQKKSQGQLFKNLIHDINSSVRYSKGTVDFKQRLQKLLGVYTNISNSDFEGYVNCIEGFDLLQTIYRSQREDLKIELKIDGDVKHLPLNNTDFYIIFGNLLQNSIEALGKEDSSVVYINVTTDLNSVRIDVKDKGTGIDSEVLGKIFAQSFSTKGVGRGHGLNILRETLFNYGGRIETMASEYGAHFMITIPKR